LRPQGEEDDYPAYTDGSIRFLGVLLVGAGGVLVGLRAVRRVRRHRLAVFAALAAVGTAYAALLRQYAPFPAERLHLLEYGLMSWILLRALRLDTGPRAAYAWSLAATVFIGFGDECIQWVLPQRVFELKDVQLNAVSGALGLAVVRLVEGPPGQVSAQA